MNSGLKADEILIDEFSRNSIEVVKTRFTRWQGKEYLDVRVWVSSHAGSREVKPTHKGICLRLDLLPSLLESLKKAKKILDEGEGL